MGDVINRFLAGKKKYSVFIATFLTSIITMAVADPQQAQELQEFVPMLSMLISGIAYLIVEGWNDGKRAQAEEAYYNMLAQTKQPYLPAETGNRTGGTVQPTAETAAVNAEPFDEARFISTIHTAAEELAVKVFPDDPHSLTSLYRAAEETGRKYECTDPRQALAYWGYLAGLAQDALDYLEHENRDDRGCKLHPPELYEFRATARRAKACVHDLEALLRTGYDWRRLGTPPYGTTVYSVGALAGEALTSG